MADPEMSVTPYWELTFDADGDVDGRQRDRLVKEMVQRKVRDLIVFSHGWNTDRSGATRLYSRFFEPVPALAPQAAWDTWVCCGPRCGSRTSRSPTCPRRWPPKFPRPPGRCSTRAPGTPSSRCSRAARRWSSRSPDSWTNSLTREPRWRSSAVWYGCSSRSGQGPQASFAADTLAEGEPAGDPLMLFGDTATVCGEFAQALAGLESPGGASFTMPRLWDGAHELLRQATYYAMKRRAGTVGERGLGPVIGQLAKASPEVRVHLVGHSFGGRLVSFALRGLPEGVRAVKSVTLLQGAFSHYAFAARLPHDPRASGALNGRQNRIDGPLVCCYSRFDSALGTIYPLASRMANDSRTVTADFGIGRKLGPEWGAMGHDGVQAVTGTRAFTLAEALKAKLPATGCVNIDAASVVKRGGSPSGAHSDICHRELAQVVLAAGRVR